VSRRQVAIAIARIAGCFAVSNRRAERGVTRRDHVQVNAANIPRAARAEIRNAHAGIPANLALEGDVVLLDAWGLQVERDGVGRRRPRERGDSPAGQRAEAVREAWPGRERRRRIVGARAPLVEGRGFERVTYALRRGG